MSDGQVGGWVIAAAFACFCLSILSLVSDAEADIDHYSCGYKACAEPELYMKKTGSASYSADYERACNTPQSPEEADLCQQWRMAYATERMEKSAKKQLYATYAEIVGLLATIVFTAWAAIAASKAARYSGKGAKAALGAVKAANRAVRQDKRAFVDQQRAWLTLDFGKSVFESPFYWNDVEGWVDVKLVFRNFGSTPAYKAVLITEFVLGSKNIDKARSDIARRMSQIPQHIGFTVVPDEELPQRIKFNIDRESADAYIQSEIQSAARISRFWPVHRGLYGIRARVQRRTPDDTICCLYRKRPGE